MSAACPTFGFEVVFQLAPGLSAPLGAALWDAFVSGPIDGRGLACGGQHRGEQWVLVVRSVAAQATDADRGAIRAWAAARPEITEVEVGALIDLGE